MSIRRLALIRHQRKHNEPLKEYFLRLACDRVSAAKDAKTPGEMLLSDLVRGVNCPELVTQLNKMAVPTAENIEAFVKNFSAMEQSAKKGTTAAVVHRNYVQRKSLNKTRTSNIAQLSAPSPSNSSTGDMEAG